MKKELPNFTEGKLGYPMFRFAVPIFGALILQTLYGIVYTFVISRYAGVAAISGISSGSQFMDSVTGIIAAFATAITVLVAQQKGAKNQEELGKLLSSCILFFAILSIACTLLITLCTGKIVEFMRTPPEAYQEAFSYIQICGTGIVAIVAYNIIGAFFSGLGNSTAPLIAVIVSFVLNIVGDFFTIGHLGMGASGAAVTTVISQYISVGVTYALFRRSNPGMLPHIGKIRLYKNHMVEILKTGIPLMFNDFLLSFSFILLLMIVNSLGVEMSASIGIAEKMFTLVLIFPKACRKTLSVVVAQCMGAQKKERAVKATITLILFGSCVGLAIAAVLFFYGPYLVGIFTKDTQLINLASQYLKACAVNCMLLGTRYGLIGYLLGCKKANIVLVDGLIGSFLVRIPLAYAFSRAANASVFAIGMSIPASAAAEILLFLVYSRWGKAIEERIQPTGRECG